MQIKPHIRAAIAATAICDSTKNPVGSVYQYGDGSCHRSITVSVDRDKVDGYDYSTSASFSGDIPNLYHYGQGAHIELKRDGFSQYSGYDYGAGAHFEVKVNGLDATFYDYGGSGYTEFSAT